MRLQVPFFSQHDNSVPKEWRERACGVTALAMALAHLTGQHPEIERLIADGVRADAYLAGIGWKHAGLVSLAQARGLRAYRKEFRKLALLQPLSRWYIPFMLKAALRRGEVPIVSIRFEQQKDTHLVALTGFDKEGWYYNDSAKRDESEGKDRFMSYEIFELRFRKLAVFVGPGR